MRFTLLTVMVERKAATFSATSPPSSTVNTAIQINPLVDSLRTRTGRSASRGLRRCLAGSRNRHTGSSGSDSAHRAAALSAARSLADADRGFSMRSSAPGTTARVVSARSAGL